MVFSKVVMLAAFVVTAMSEKRNVAWDDDEGTDNLLRIGVILAAIIVVSQIRLCAQRRIRKRLSQRRTRLSVSNVFAGYTDREFTRAYRMRHTTFSKLVELLRPHLKRNKYRAHSMEEEGVIAIFIRMMAGGDPHDIRRIFEVGPSTVYSLFKECVNVVVNELALPGLPMDIEELKAASKAFTSSRGYPFNPLHGCVGALDGLSISIDKPSDIENPTKCFSRKGAYALSVQALCDSKYRFLACSAICDGATHDAIAFEMSNINKFLLQNNLPQGFWLVGDEAYRRGKHLLIPFNHHVAGEWEDAFSFHQSSLRIHIEQAFGYLKNKWRILRSPLAFDTDLKCKVIVTAMILHNFVIEEEGIAKKALFTGEQLAELSSGLNDWLERVKENEEGEKLDLRSLCVKVVEESARRRPHGARRDN